MSVFKPHYIFEKTTKITPEFLKELGITNLLLDVDNTLTTHYCPDLSDEVATWLKTVAAAGIALTIVSNAKQYRVEPFAAKVGLSCVWMAARPLPAISNPGPTLK